MSHPKYTVRAYVSLKVEDENGRTVTEIDVREDDGANAAVVALATTVLDTAKDRIERMLAADFASIDKAEAFDQLALTIEKDLSDALRAIETPSETPSEFEHRRLLALDVRYEQTGKGVGLDITRSEVDRYAPRRAQ